MRRCPGGGPAPPVPAAAEVRGKQPQPQLPACRPQDPLRADSHVAIKMDEGTLVAVLNAAASSGDVEVAHLAWDLLQRSLVQPTPLPLPAPHPMPHPMQHKATAPPPSRPPQAAAPGAHPASPPRPPGLSPLLPPGAHPSGWQCPCRMHLRLTSIALRLREGRGVMRRAQRRAGGLRRPRGLRQLWGRGRVAMGRAPTLPPPPPTQVAKVRPPRCPQPQRSEACAARVAGVRRSQRHLC